MENKQQPIRVKLNLINANCNSYELANFHHIPREGDLMNIIELMDEDFEKNYSESELSKIYSLAWGVDYVSWSRDEKGFYVDVCCSGE